VIGWACDSYDRLKECIQKFAGKIEGKIPFGLKKRKWKNNISMKLIIV
jgi:hypothetical protein